MTRTGATLSSPARNTARAAQRALSVHALPAHAAAAARFFKTAAGQYGAGDVFRGVRVPQVRLVARAFNTLAPPELAQLLASRWHEDRLLAVIILAMQFERASRAGEAVRCAKLYDFYVAHLPRVNNWDLVDVSAEKIIGAHLWHSALKRACSAAAVAPDVRPLYGWAASEVVWERRVAIISTLYFIRQGLFGPTLELARRLLADRHDLIHKVVGWMLREVGKRNADALRRFLTAHHHSMPRTMLRYAIERLDTDERGAWLQGMAA